MIDLRSDTLTMPTEEMRKAAYEARVGDEGRTDAKGKGEDPTVNALEELAAEITGKESAVFVTSGTLGNLIALMTYCSRGDTVAVERNLHVYRTEKAPFSERVAGLKPVFYETETSGKPNIVSIKELITKAPVKVLCLENTHNFAGGICFTTDDIKTIMSIVKKKNILIHMDGARIFNAAVMLNAAVSELLWPVDSVMFCLSKGLGAPVGSILCGKSDFIFEARKTKRLLGGVMRQAGIIAAAGIVALKSGVERLREDHENARLLAERISGNENINLNLETVQTNILMVDISPSGRNANTFKQELEKRGLKVHAMSERHVRMVTYRGITKGDIIKAADIFNAFCKSIS